MREISENRLTAPARRLLNSLMNLLQHIKRTHINALTITLQRGYFTREEKYRGAVASSPAVPRVLDLKKTRESSSARSTTKKKKRRFSSSPRPPFLASSAKSPSRSDSSLRRTAGRYILKKKEEGRVISPCEWNVCVWNDFILFAGRRRFLRGLPSTVQRATFPSILHVKSHHVRSVIDR